MAEKTTSSTSALDGAAAAISTASDHGLAIALVVVVAALLRRGDLRRAAARLAVVGFPVLAINALTKRVVGRDRPDEASEAPAGVRTPTSSSFPSGHTLAAATAAVALPASPLGMGAGLLGAGAVGWSRVRLKAHHGGDVAGGLVLGALLGALLRSLVGLIGRE